MKDTCSYGRCFITVNATHVSFELLIVLAIDDDAASSDNVLT